MKIYKSLLFSILMIILCDCKKQSSEVQIINVPVNNLDNMVSYNTLIDTLWVRKLDTTGDNLISMCFRIILYENYIYVFDLPQQTVFIFNDEGKYLAKIDSKGKGPEEYIQINHISMNKNNLVLYDGVRKKLIFYSPDGEFIEEKDEPIAFLNMLDLNNGSRVYYTGHLFNQDRNILNHNVTIRTRNNKIRNFIDNTGEFENKISSCDNYFFQAGNTVFFQIPFRNTIYEVDKDFLTPKYEIHLDKKFIPEYAFKTIKDLNEFRFKFYNDEFIYLLGSIQATPNHIIIPLFSNQKLIGHVWYSRHTGKVIIGKGIINEENGENVPFYARFAKGDTLVTALDGIYESATDQELHREDNENPTLIFYRLKKF